MELLPGLLALQLLATGAAFAWLWRRQQQLSGEILQLRQEVQARSARRARHHAEQARRAEPGSVVAVPFNDVANQSASPAIRAARAWKLDTAPPAPAAEPIVSADTARGLTLALMATVPAFGLLFGARESALASAGLAIAAAMMLIALRPGWRTAAWAGVLTAAAWAMIGFLRGGAHAEPLTYCICAAIAAGAGLIYARRELLPGAAMAFTAGAAALALAGQTTMVGPAGAAFALIVAAAAVVGAMNLRLESIHLAAFVASLIGLFVLSGQDGAAIWFTPAAAWTGALFFAVAFVRVPQLGSRGASLAGTGSLAPFASITALHSAQHGLASAYAASGAFAALAALLAALIAVSVLLQRRGVGGLKLTLWVLSFGAFASLAGSILLSAPAPAAAPLFAAAAACLLALNLKIPASAWRTFACAAGLASTVLALISAELFLAEASAWPPYAVIALGLFAPALISGAAVAAASRAQAHATAGFFEMIVIVLGVVFAGLVARLYFSGGATLLQPIGLQEAGVHAAIWLAAALIIGSRPPREERGVRPIAIHVLTFMGLGGMLIASVVWTASYAAAEPPYVNEALGFLLPGMLCWAHWVFWRGRDVNLHTRISLGAGALLIAAALTVHVIRTEGVSDSIKALVGALSFALAIGVNFAPGVTATEVVSDFQKNLHRHRRRQQRRYLR